MKFIFNLISTYDVPTLVIGIFTLYLEQCNSNQNTYLEIYKTFLAPIFFKLEPFLYKEVSEIPLTSIISELNSFFTSKSIYVDWNIKTNFEELSKFPSQENYIKFCKCIDKEFDNISKKLGLKRRSLLYRINNDQYHNYLTLVCYLVRFSLPYISFLFVSIVVIMSSCSIIRKFIK